MKVSTLTQSTTISKETDPSWRLLVMKFIFRFLRTAVVKRMLDIFIGLQNLVCGLTWTFLFRFSFYREYLGKEEK